MSRGADSSLQASRQILDVVLLVVHLSVAVLSYTIVAGVPRPIRVTFIV